MKKTCILILILSITTFSFSQRKSNPKIGKNETEIAAFIMGDYDLAYGGQLVYRLSVIKKLKLGAGILYGANYENGSSPGIYGYGAVFADALYFVGHRQKWSFGGQIGHGFYNRDLPPFSKIKAGIYYNISANYRAIISNKLLFTTSLFIGYRNFHFEGLQGTSTNNTGFSGLKLGVVF
ncbi:MAG TPA: hypothetical protein VKB95_03905 [Chitinophagaceae bacterium]|nr:hypothetical protein [Chitinophagaceae bacterium]